MTTLTVWCNHGLNSEQEKAVRQATTGHELVLAKPGQSLEQSTTELASADIAFGQPPLSAILASPQLKWVQVASAGYGNYDRDGSRATLVERGVALTKSSAVYAEPCAQHVLACMLAQSRLLPSCFANQQAPREWPHGETRRHSRLLRDQNVVIVGFGSIGARLVQMLQPFTSNITGVRRTVADNEVIPMLAQSDPQVASALNAADHVVNVLPGVSGTQNFFDRERLEQIRNGAVFYNVGRGTTVDQETLAQRLVSGALSAAWLDVTNPEPLPSSHPLWDTPNCFVTPHSAGGHHNEGDRLVSHFTDNFARFVEGTPFEDRAI